jgi:hypothetical protein
MFGMENPRRDRRHFFTLLALLALSLGMNQGCARPEPLRVTAANSAASAQKLPFHGDSDSDSATDSAVPASSTDPKLAGGVPFRSGSSGRMLPPGTLLTVQLDSSLSADTAGAGDVFMASVAAPLTIDGDTLVKTGTAVTGRVESIQTPSGSPAATPGSVSETGYFQLTLSRIAVDGRQLAIQTSSLFARGTPRAPSSSAHGTLSDVRSDVRNDVRSQGVHVHGIQVRKGRRLTFRLTAPVALDATNSVAERQSPSLPPQ